MRYFEFKKPDYYALVAVKPSTQSPMIHAMKIYVEHVAYDSVDELRRDSLHPNEVTKEQAQLKYFLAPGNGDVTADVLKKQFNDCKDSVLLIDGSLI